MDNAHYHLSRHGAPPVSFVSAHIIAEGGQGVNERAMGDFPHRTIFVQFQDRQPTLPVFLVALAFLALLLP
jgi:hypothetical protein